MSKVEQIYTLVNETAKESMGEKAIAVKTYHHLLH